MRIKPTGTSRSGNFSPFAVDCRVSEVGWLAGTEAGFNQNKLELQPFGLIIICWHGNCSISVMEKKELNRFSSREAGASD